MTTEEPAYTVVPEPVGGPAAPSRLGPRRRLVGAVVVMLLVVGVVAALGATGRIGLPATPAVRVALVDPDGSLAIVDAQGGNRVVHAPPGTVFSFPAWSPDGTRVAAVSNAGDGAAIEVFSAGGADSAADGTVLFKSDTEAPFYLYWTPDGRAVTFLTEEGSSLALRSAPADGSAGATRLREGNPMYWTWEGPSRMLVHTGADTDAFLGAVGTDGATVTTVDGVPGVFRAPAASADGRYEAYAVARPDGSGAVVVAAIDGTSHHEIPVFGPAAVGFAPSGSQVAFIGADQGDAAVPLPVGRLRVADAATGEVRQLPAQGVVSFFWSPDGRTIATIGVATSGATPAASGRVRLASVAYSRTSVGAAGEAPGVDAALVFVDVASATATSATIVHLTPTFVNQLMPYFDQYALSHRVWAPDGSAILLPIAADDGTESLEVLPADGSAARVLAPGSMGFWSP